jgi:hypothetical protein
MPTPTIPAGNLFMNATLYTGDGANPRVITNGASGASFQPDFLWLKNRSAGWGNTLQNSVVGASYLMQSNSTGAEVNQFQYGYTTSFNSNGFSVTTGSTDDYFTNNSGENYVAWQWKAGGTAVTNTSGTISSQVSTNTTSGFSVVGWTGNGSVATIGHGLGVTPSFIFGKRRDGVSNWYVYHSSLGATKGMNLNSSDAAVTNSGWWNNTAPTSSVFTMGTYETNSGSPFIAYCFAPIAGYSAFGSYTGNGSTDGPFVYTGFRPRFLLTRRSDAVESWRIGDSSRSPYNAVQLELFANLANAEENNSNPIDYLSNGFKIRTSSSSHNASGGTYIYAAFAESPFKYSSAR